MTAADSINRTLAAPVRIVLIGAGSAMFTRGLVADLITHGGRWELALVDIDPEALDIAHRLTERMVAVRGADISISAHTDRRDALTGAHYVVTTIAAGGRRAWENDVLIPRRYGIYQPVGDTIMPGGISRAMRLIPAMTAIASDVAELSPEARMFNYANPMSAICRAVRRATGVEITGLCHGVKNGARHLAGLLNVDLNRCRFRATGMNHMAFFSEMFVDDEDARYLLRRALEHQPSPPSDHLRRWLFDHFAQWSVLDDRHLAEFFPQFFRDGRHPGGRLGVELFSFEDCIEGGDRGYRSMAAQADGSEALEESLFRRSLGEHEQLVSIIDALEGNAEEVFSVNLPNTGQAPGLPEQAVVECPAEISGAGIKPLPAAGLHSFIEASVSKALATVELTVEAALESDKELFLAALVHDGSVRSPEDARSLASELWESNLPFIDGAAP